MPYDLLAYSLHLAAALLLFFIINWVGRHAVEFGYSSASLFDDGEESIALNLFVKTLLPTVFIVVLSAAVVALDRPDLRLGVTRVVYCYFFIRILAIFLLDRTKLVSWPKFLFHAAIGISLAHLAYEHLILPKVSLLPDLTTAGNELWLAIFAFFYAIANKVPLSGEPAARRKNAFVRAKYLQIERSHGEQINDRLSDDRLKLIVYAIAIAEDYARPSAIRVLERILPGTVDRTTGIMQVRSAASLSDEESMELAINRLEAAWNEASKNENGWEIFKQVVASHNRDEDYIWKVSDIAELIAKRADRSFETALEAIRL